MNFNTDVSNSPLFNIFKYLSAFSLGISFTYFTLGYDAQSLVTLGVSILAIGAYKLFNRYS